MTVLQRDRACELGFDAQTADPSSVTVPGGGVVVGYDFPVELRVGKRHAKVLAFVPAYRLMRSGIQEPVDAGENLIGCDFLKATGAKVDFEASDLMGAWPTGWSRRRATRLEARIARKLFKCPG
jgi:hypothetical protein